MIDDIIDLTAHPLASVEYATTCQRQLDADGALILAGFFTQRAIAQVVEQSTPFESQAYYADSTHNVYLTPSDPALADDHPFNRQILSTKGLIADNQVPADSPLRAVYDSEAFRTFLCRVLGIDAIYPYADDMSSINVHFAAEGMELGWHFDNSSFAVTMLLQAAEAGGVFEHVPAVRCSATGDQAFERVRQILDGEVEVATLAFSPGDLVLFRGRDAMHRVTPTIGNTTRMLSVFAYNDQPGIALSESARKTFYGWV